MKCLKKKMLFFVNPNAGHGEIRSSLIEVLQIFTLAGYDVTVHPTSRAKEITSFIEAEGMDYDVIVSTGGDGTFNETVSGLMTLQNPPDLGFIPAGTVNDVATTFQLPRSILKAATAIVSGDEMWVDVASFNERWFTYIAAFGAFTGVPYLTQQADKRILGRLAYILRGVQSLTELRAIPAKVTCNGETFEDKFLVGLVTSTTSVGGFKTTKTNMAVDDGLFEIILVREIKNILDFNTVAAAVLRQDYDNEFFYFFKTDSIQFQFDTQVPWTLDGEYGGTVEQVDVQVHQQAIHLRGGGRSDP